MTDTKVPIDIPDRVRSVTATGGVEPAACDCTPSPGDPTRLVYALGQIGYDFMSESRLNSIRQKMGPEKRPENSRDLLEYLDANPHDAPAIQWVLKLESAPIYAVEPAGPFAREAYDLLRRFLREQVEEGVERVSLPGIVSGTTRLQLGVVVPAVQPEVRGMYSWTTAALVAALTGATPKAVGKGTRDRAVAEGIRNFLDRVYYQIRNTGRSPQERAINFAATNAFDIGKVYEQAIRDEMDLDSVDVQRSPISNIGTDCWDVSLTFFYPQRQVQTVRKVYRLTVDVADVVPSTVGPVRSWFVR